MTLFKAWRFSLFGWQFTIQPIPAWAALFGFIFFVWFGWFEIQRAHTKQRIIQHYQQRHQLPPLGLPQLKQRYHDRQGLQYYPICLHGRWDPAHTLLLDNQIVSHQAGYDVLTPFYVPGEQRPFLINRGWIPGSPDRQLPKLPQLQGTPQATVCGLLYQPAKTPPILNHDYAASSVWPRRIQTLALPLLNQQYPSHVHRWIILLNKKTNNVFTTHWKSVTMISPERHIGYAVQFFALALIIVVLALGLNGQKKHDHDSKQAPSKKRPS